MGAVFEFSNPAEAFNDSDSREGFVKVIEPSGICGGCKASEITKVRSR